MRFSIYQESKRGGRKVNQDRMGYCYTRDALLLVVCDGMGGHLNGEIAAQISVQTIGALFQRDARPTLKDPRQFLEDAMLTAHIEIHRYRAGRGLPESPRTTAVACIVQRGVAYWAHAGDSRLYLLRDGAIHHVTRDHSQLEAMIQDGLLDQRDRADYPERNRLFNCLGAPAMPLVELADPVRLLPGDHLLLCSDGLWGAVPDTIIASAFRSNSVMRVVPELINYALMQAGARADNVSAVGMTWESDTSPEDERAGASGRGADAFTSTIQFPPQGKAAPDHSLSDDDIESAIADIRKAIAASHKGPPPKR